MDAADVIAAVDSLAYMSQFLDFEERGGEYWALSPFKEECTPSFSLRPENGYWYDFSSGCGGNIVDFIMRMKHVGVAAAISELRRFAGIADGEDGETRSQRLSAARVCKKFRPGLERKPRKQPKPLGESCMDRYAQRSDKLALWADEGISHEAMRRFGVAYDPLDDRIVYPIRDYDGRIISVCGRTCDPDFKKKKIRKYTYYQSVGTIDTLCGFSDNRDAILASHEIILFEGIKSVMKAYGWGILNGAALLTSHMSDSQLRFLIPFCNFNRIRVVMALDADVDVSKDENIRRLSRYTRVEVIKDRDGMLDEKDAPVDKGEAVFRQLYERRERLGMRE